MQLTVTIRHIDDAKKKENLKSYVLKKIKRIERHIKTNRHPSEVRFVLSEQKFRNIAEVFVSSGSYKSTSTAETEDMYAAIDRVIETIIKQLKKHTDKKIKTKRRTGGKTKEIKTSTGTPKSISNKELNRINIKKLPAKPISIEEAILQLKVSDENFIVFNNSDSGEMNVLFKGKRGKIELVTP